MNLGLQACLFFFPLVDARSKDDPALFLWGKTNGLSSKSLLTRHAKMPSTDCEIWKGEGISVCVHTVVLRRGQLSRLRFPKVHQASSRLVSTSCTSPLLPNLFALGSIICSLLPPSSTRPDGWSVLENVERENSEKLCVNLWEAQNFCFWEERPGNGLRLLFSLHFLSVAADAGWLLNWKAQQNSSTRLPTLLFSYICSWPWIELNKSALEQQMDCAPKWKCFCNSGFFYLARLLSSFRFCSVHLPSCWTVVKLSQSADSLSKHICAYSQHPANRLVRHGECVLFTPH